MKKLLFALLGAFIVSAVPAFATTVNVTADGTVWTDKPPPVYKARPVVSQIEVIFDKGVISKVSTWKEALAKKGTVVPLPFEAHVEYWFDGLLYIESASVVDVGIVYDGTRMSIVRDVVSWRKSTLSLYVVFWLLSTVFMLVSVRNVKRGKSFSTALAAIFAAAAAADAAIVVLDAVVPAFIFVASAAFFAALLTLVAVASDSGSSNDKKAFFASIIAYYIAMMISMAGFISIFLSA